MRWTSVAWACCLLPVLTGCGTTSRVVHGASGGSVTNETDLRQVRRADDFAHREGRTAWQTVAARSANHAFSDEFRDGFTDGYADVLQHGTGAQPPAVPLVSYARYQKYFGPEGHGLVRDYYLGFNYGVEEATGARRPGGTTPGSPPAPPTEPAPRSGAPAPPKSEMPPPRPLPETGKFGEPKRGSDSPILLPPPPESGKGSVVPPLPKPELPVIKPFNPDLRGGKFAPIPVPSEPERLPVPDPPLPVSAPLVSPIAVPADAPKDAPPIVIPPAVVVPVASIPPAK